VYDYFIKDHLGNVRMVLTDQKDTAFYPAVTYEAASIANESIYYDSVDVERVSRPGAFYSSSTNGSWVQLLRKSTHSIGAGKLLKVMAKDRIHVKVDYYIANDATDNSDANGVNSIISILTNLLNSSTQPVLHGAGTTLTNNLNNSFPFTNFLAPETGSGGSMPKAFLNILFFDEQFRFVSANSEIVQVDTKGSGQTILRIDGDAKEAVKNGYCYVFVSNESNNLVYFDNLQVTHEKGPITQETHYYPFGLTMAGISSKAMGKMENSYKFNAGTELNDDLGVAMYETAFRGYDAQIGRFGQVDPMADSYTDWSPYCFAFDDPVFWNDPLGADPDYGGRYVQDQDGNWNYTPFYSSEEAFLYGAQYASEWNLWGSYDGMAGSFDEAWTNYNGGFLTSGMAAGYFSMLWGAQVSGLSAGYAEGGYNLSYTATSTGNSYGGLFFSMDYISDGIDRMMDVDRNKAPLGEDMTSPSDWLYQFNKTWNPSAVFSNTMSTYAHGADMYGVRQSNLEATVNLLAILPVGKLVYVGESVASSVVREGLTNAELIQGAATKAEAAIGGTGRFAGTAKHTYATELLERYQKIYGDRGLETNVFFNNNAILGPGNRGFLDVLDRTNGVIYDFKFGNAVMSNDQYTKYTNNFGLPIQIIRP
jgi:RHS repeat-associated protein